MPDINLEQIAAEKIAQEIRGRTIRALDRAENSWIRCDELCRLDMELLGRSRELIAHGRKWLKHKSVTAEEATTS